MVGLGHDYGSNYSDGTYNYVGGGGCGYDGSNWISASGGAGIVIVRYPLPRGTMLMVQ